MSQGANVSSVDAIRDFKIALINFAEDAKNGLGATEMEIRQVRNWLQRDQLSYWQSQVKRGQERLSMARADLHRRQLSQSNSDAVSDTEFSRDGKFVVTASNYGTARIFSTELAGPIQTVEKIAGGRMIRQLTPEEIKTYHVSG